MSDNYEYDPIGELFRQRFENHRTPVDDSDWDEIEHRLQHRKNKSLKWLWISGSAAAAAVALIVTINTLTYKPAMKTAAEESFPAAQHETIPTAPAQESTIIAQVGVDSLFNDSKIPKFNDSKIQLFNDSVNQLFSYSVINDSVNQLFSYSVINDSVNQLISYSVIDDFDDFPAKKADKWKWIAVLGAGGYVGGIDGGPYDKDMVTKTSSGNEYAANLSCNIRSFDHMTKEEFTKINHLPPFSLGMTARNLLGQYGGIETGLVYNCLVSHFTWSDWANNDVRQSLHYVGVPVNMILYPGDRSRPNLQFYLSGGFMVEKGVRAVYKQNRQSGGEQVITTVRSSIDGWQWSLSGAMGFNYRLGNGFSFYLEPRLGYYFKNRQPISIRTEYPVNFGIHIGLNYEL